MKAIMKSIKPKTCANVMNLIQSLLVIKSKREATAIQKLIDKNGYAEFYVYCTKSKKDYLYYYKDFEDYITLPQDFGKLNGKVLFKFRCYKMEEIKYQEYIVADFYDVGFETETLLDTSLYRKSCLSYFDLVQYLGDRNTGYAIYISDLEIFDKPKELSEFRYATCPQTNCEYCRYNKTVEGDLYCTRKPLIKAPTGHCYVEVE